jgi:hypothetical protein
VEDIGAEICDGDRNLVGHKAHADHIRRVRIELQHDARASTASVTDGADLQRSYEPVVQKSGGDSGDRRGAKLSVLANLDAGHWPMATNCVHHVEAVYRAHEFWVAGLHRLEGVSEIIILGPGLIHRLWRAVNAPFRQRSQPKDRSSGGGSRIALDSFMGTRQIYFVSRTKKPGPDSGRKTMSLRHLALAAVCATAFSAPAFADTTVTLLHVSEDKTAQALWDQIAKDYEAAHPGVKVEVKYLENEAFKAKLPTMLQADESRPSLFYSWAAA